MFKGIANLASMMKQAQEMGGRLQSLTESLKSQRVTGVAGGGLVEVEMNGAGEMLRLQIDPSLDREMIEDLVPAAVNSAQAKAKEMHAQAMQEMTSDMDLPGLDEALAKFNGGQ
ncbi:MAG: YbaB/EbfC family nucleoid-associated protein [Pirellulaceae bacterium]|nr:YbaB/EbfC family nucleoid-associated protein [Pirellulaceae bacterium]MDP7014284.1 YbaB/EbfC family nucleoid-associated protein [Pirellulaceae bacterium]